MSRIIDPREQHRGRLDRLQAARLCPPEPKHTSRLGLFACPCGRSWDKYDLTERHRELFAYTPLFLHTNAIGTDWRAAADKKELEVRRASRARRAAAKVAQGVSA